MAAQMRMPVSLRNQAQLARAQRQMDAVEQQLSKTLAPLIDKQLITIRRNDLWIEVEINSDILFGTGSATLAGRARGRCPRWPRCCARRPMACAWRLYR